MSDQKDALIALVSGLRDQMNQRFDSVDNAIAEVKTLEPRVRALERDATRMKTIGTAFTAVLTFVGWEHFKAAWIALTK